MPSLNSCWKSALCVEKIVLISTEEQLSGKDSRELTTQVSEKASPSVQGMLPNTTLYLALFCLYFYSFSLSPKIESPFMCQSSFFSSVF